MRYPKRIRIRVPASTSNLGPGYDTLGLALALHNEFIFESDDCADEILVEGEGRGAIPTDSTNRTRRAFVAAYARTTQSGCQGIRITQNNAVPLQRGLGGSATAVVAGTLAGLVFSGHDPSESEVLDLAIRLETHPDNITPCLVGGATVSVLDGPHVKYVRVTPPSELTTVMFIPDKSLDTDAARRVVPEQFSREDTVFNIRGAAMVIAALATGRLEHLGLAMRDRLHQPYREQLLPWMTVVFNAALEAGSPGVALSGAGSGVFAFAHRQDRMRIADSMEAAAGQKGIRGYCLHLEIDNEGARIEELSY